MRATSSIRVIPAVFKDRRGGDPIPTIRFVDPDITEEPDREFFRVHLDHVEMLIEGIRRAARDARAGCDLYAKSDAADRALLERSSGGQA